MKDGQRFQSRRFGSFDRIRCDEPRYEPVSPLFQPEKTWWEREGLDEPCPNWRPGTRRCNCEACCERRRAL